MTGDPSRGAPRRAGRRWPRALAAAIGVPILLGFLAIQLAPVRRDNPPVTSDLVAPVEVETILRRACYDCHSNETRWPWYSRVAPVSWFVADHVRVGRAELNFSSWESLGASRRRHLLEEIDEVLEAHSMPLSSYLRMHAEARLTDEQRALLQSWTRDQRAADTRSAE